MKRSWILWILFLALIYVVITRFVEIRQFVRVLLQGQWQWVLAAALLQGLHYILYAAIYDASFETVGVESHMRELVPVVFASLFVNFFAITGGVAIFIDDMATRGRSAARATAGTILGLIADYGTFVILVIVTIAYLATQHLFTTLEIITASILVSTTVGLALVLLLALWRPLWLRGLLNWVQRAINQLGRWIRHKPWLPEDWARRNASEFAQAAFALVTRPRPASYAFLYALIHHLVGVISLYTLFLAFHQPVTAWVLLAAYTMGILFWTVSPTPQGIGFVEGAMVLTMTSLGIPAASATVITLAFRGVSFWLPLLVGVLFWPRVRSFGGK